MQRKDMSKRDLDSTSSPQTVTEESIQAKEVSTVPSGSLQTRSELRPEISVRSIASTPSIVLPVPLVAQPLEDERSLGEWLSIWWSGIRPAYFSLALLPVILGSVAAWTQSITPKMPRGDFHPIKFVLAVATVLLLQAGAQLVNDYYDYARGIDTSNSLGPGGLIQRGLIKPERLLFFGLIALGLGAVFGAVVAVTSGWLVVAFGLIGILSAFFYSGVPRALSSLALGDLVFFFVFGPLLTLGSYAAQTGHLDRIVYTYSISLGLLAAAFIHLNDMRDTSSDVEAGKHTLASILGLRLNRALYAMLVLGAYVPILALGLPAHAPHLLLLVLWTIPVLVIAITTVMRTASPASLHVAMHQTLRLETYFTLLLIAALVVTAVSPVLPHLTSIPLPF